MIDLFFEGINFSKVIYIISSENDEISRKINFQINRGVTGLYGKGMYKDKDKLILMCAVGRQDVANIKKLIIDIDKEAFVVVTKSREVLGYGFK